MPTGIIRTGFEVGRIGSHPRQLFQYEVVVKSALKRSKRERLVRAAEIMTASLALIMLVALAPSRVSCMPTASGVDKLPLLPDCQNVDSLAFRDLWSRYSSDAEGEEGEGDEFIIQIS